MADKPNTISDREWSRVQKAAADAAGGLVKNAAQKAKSATWSEQRGKARSN
jgi:hypothetical protein